MSDELIDKPVKRVAKTLTDAELKQAVLTTKELLDLQPKVKIRLRKNSDPKLPNYETVQVNGYTWTIMRGVEVEVPQVVKDILIEAELL